MAALRTADSGCERPIAASTIHRSLFHRSLSLLVREHRIASMRTGIYECQSPAIASWFVPMALTMVAPKRTALRVLPPGRPPPRLPREGSTIAIRQCGRSRDGDEVARILGSAAPLPARVGRGLLDAAPGPP